MNTLISKLALGETVIDKDIENALEEMCENAHSSCDSSCIVYELNGCRIPNRKDSRYGCDCFKNGMVMLDFIRNSKKA